MNITSTHTTGYDNSATAFVRQSPLEKTFFYSMIFVIHLDILYTLLNGEVVKRIQKKRGKS